MRIAHIIMAYKDPSQIERLVRKMSHPSLDFYIHVDAKFDIGQFKNLVNIERVYFIKMRTKVRWAGYSFTKGVLRSVEEILNNKIQYDFISCISGQDYPVKSTDYYYHFFLSQPGKNFISASAYGNDWWKKIEKRVFSYHMVDFDFKGRYFIERVLNAFLPKKRFPLDLILYGSDRGTWWTITSDCARYILNFIKQHPEIERFAKFSWGADEFLLPTIIMNSPFKDMVVPDNLRYLDWSQGGSSPKILTVNDFDTLKKTDKLLARKFDIKVDTNILDLLDDIT